MNRYERKSRSVSFGRARNIAFTLVLTAGVAGAIFLFGSCSKTPSPSTPATSQETVLKDKTAPKISGAVNLTVFVGDTVSYQEHVTVTDNEDPNPTLQVDSSKVDLTKEGTYEVTYTATDLSGNKTIQTVTVTVEKKDDIAPVIDGAENLTVFIGDTVSYRKNITVTDNEDPNPTLQVDSSQVDLTKEGTYEVTYAATDASGNTAIKTITVTVQKEAPPATSDDVYTLADKKLKSLLTDGMTVRQQVEAIYNWANTCIWYSGKSTKDDYLVEAKKVLEGGGTDCFGYFAVTKLMFERLQIPNIDVIKVKNHAQDSSHYWSLVSVDGGQTYYHFDATPRKGDGDRFLLVTDAELDAYSDQHNKCHNRDKSLYPATPEE